MRQQGVRESNIDALIACYKILDYDVIDPETVRATFNIDLPDVVKWFDVAECEGLIQQVNGSMYELTESGEQKLMNIMVRSSSD